MSRILSALGCVVVVSVACGSSDDAATGAGSAGASSGGASAAGTGGSAAAGTGGTTTAGTGGTTIAGTGGTSTGGTAGAGGTTTAGAGGTTTAGSGGTTTAGAAGATTAGAAGSTSIVAADGGTISGDGITVEIPPGALAANTKITLGVSAPSQWQETPRLASKVYDLGPNGTKFSKPVKITIDYAPAQVTADKTALLSYFESNKWVALADSATAAGKAVATTTHFTPFVVYASGGDPAPGKATISATFSAPVDGYNGTLTPYEGLEAGSECKSVGTGLSVNTYTVDGVPNRDNVSITFGNMVPVEGMTFALPYDLLKGTGITYQSLKSTTVYVWGCPGTLTFDAIVGKTHRFHFTGTCSNPGLGGKGVGGVTITGTGVGVLP